MKFALDSYAARSCPVKTFNAFSPDLTRPPDESDQQLSAVFHRSREHRRDIVERLRNNPQVLDMATVDDRQAATLDAMSRGVVAILNPRLPTDWENHRSGHPDLLVHDGKSGYCPVRIKPYLVLETQTGNRELQVSGLSDLTKRSVLQSRRYRSRGKVRCWSWPTTGDCWRRAVSLPTTRAAGWWGRTFPPLDLTSRR